MDRLVYFHPGRDDCANHCISCINPGLFMKTIDWVVLLLTILFIVAYGTIKTRKTETMEGFLKGDNTLKWWMMGISIMATQASAITFLSTQIGRASCRERV